MRDALISLLDRLFCWIYKEGFSVPGDAQFRYWRSGGRWSYTLVAGNNEPLSTSTQTYVNKSAVLRAIEQHRRNAGSAVVVETGSAPTE